MEQLSQKKWFLFFGGKVGNCVVLFHHTCCFWLGKVSHVLAPEFVRLHFACEAPNSPRGAHHGLWSKLEDLSWTSSHGDESIGKHNSKQWEIHYVDGIFTRKKNGNVHCLLLVYRSGKDQEIKVEKFKICLACIQSEHVAKNSQASRAGFWISVEEWFSGFAYTLGPAETRSWRTNWVPFI